MPRQSRSASKQPGHDIKPPAAWDGPFRAILVDADQGVGRELSRCLDDGPATLVQVHSVAEARRLLAEGPVELAMIEVDLPDGSGIGLAQEVLEDRPETQTIMITGQLHPDQTLEAMRVGARDFLLKPLNRDEVSHRVRQAIERRSIERQRKRRVKRLRRICKKLNRAREEVAQQVDILCNDLVTAYQELANNMQQAVQGSEFAGQIRQELDLEFLLRRTLEYLLQKVGPTNAAIFLPASMDEYSLGGYVNYDCTADTADLLLQHLADIVAPKVSEHEGMVHLTDNQSLGVWIGDDSAYLEDNHFLGFPCMHDEEALAVVVLFRDQLQPFGDSVLQVCSSIGPILGNYLARVIRIHHRHMPQAGDEQGLYGV